MTPRIAYASNVLICATIVGVSHFPAHGQFITYQSYDRPGTLSEWYTSQPTEVTSQSLSSYESAKYMTYDSIGRKSVDIQLSDLYHPETGITTIYNYDVAGNLSTKAVKTVGAALTIESSDLQMIYEYDDYGRNTRTWGPSADSSSIAGSEVLQEYDSVGQLTRQKIRAKSSPSVVYAETEYRYDALGRAITTWDPLRHYKTSQYDSRGQVVQELAFDSAGTPLQQSRMLYDAVGRLTCRARLAKADKPAAEAFDIRTDNVIYSVYDLGGRVIEEKTFNMNASAPLITRSDYDGFGRLIKCTNPDALYERLEYDGAGRLTLRAKGALGQTETKVRNIVDIHGRITETHDEGSGQNPPLITRYIYSDGGRRLTAIDSLSRQTWYEYDLLGRQTRLVENATDSVASRTTEYVYSKSGTLSLQKVTNTGNVIETTQYDYDKENRVKSIAYPDAPAGTESDKVEYSYYPNGAVSLRKEQGPDATTRPILTYLYDLRGMLLTKADPTKQYFVTYGYDGLGRMTMASKGTESDATAISQTLYAYDDLSRVIGEHQSIAGDNAKSVNAGFDQSGERTFLVYPNPNQ